MHVVENGLEYEPERIMRGRAENLIYFFVSLFCSALLLQAQRTEFTMENGLQVVFLPGHQSEQLCLRLMVRVGAIDGEEEEQGMAHFLEHMLFAGTKRFPDMNITDFLQARNLQVGVTVNAYTRKTTTAFHYELYRGDDENIRFVLQLFSDYLRGDALLDAGEVEAEKPVILREMERKADHEYSRLQTLLQLVVPSSEWSRLSIGERSTVLQATGESLRDFYKRYYTPSRAVLLVTGSFDEWQIRRLINEEFAFGAPSMPVSKQIMSADRAFSAGLFINGETVRGTLPSRDIRFGKHPEGVKAVWLLPVPTNFIERETFFLQVKDWKSSIEKLKHYEKDILQFSVEDIEVEENSLLIQVLLAGKKPAEQYVTMLRKALLMAEENQDTARLSSLWQQRIVEQKRKLASWAGYSPVRLSMHYYSYLRDGRTYLSPEEELQMLTHVDTSVLKLRANFLTLEQAQVYVQSEKDSLSQERLQTLLKEKVSPAEYREPASPSVDRAVFMADYASSIPPATQNDEKCLLLRNGIELVAMSNPQLAREVAVQIKLPLAQSDYRHEYLELLKHVLIEGGVHETPGYLLQRAFVDKAYRVEVDSAGDALILRANGFVEDVPFLLSYLREQLLHPAFNKYQFTQKKKNFLRAVGRQDFPNVFRKYVATPLLQEKRYVDAAEVETITREALMQYYQTLVQATPWKVTIAGDAEAESLLAWGKEIFSPVTISMNTASQLVENKGSYPLINEETVLPNKGQSGLVLAIDVTGMNPPARRIFENLLRKETIQIVREEYGYVYNPWIFLMEAQSRNRAYAFVYLLSDQKVTLVQEATQSLRQRFLSSHPPKDDFLAAQRTILLDEKRRIRTNQDLIVEREQPIDDIMALSYEAFLEQFADVQQKETYLLPLSE